MELLSLTLSLRPLAPAKEGEPLPLWWGRAAHALLLDVLRQYDPALSQRLHDHTPEDGAPAANDIRPVTASTLIGRFSAGGFDEQRPYSLRLTAFLPAAAQILAQAAQDGPLAPGRSVELDFYPFTILSIAPDLTPGAAAGQPSGWSASANYADLAADFLLARRPPPRRISFSFASPVTFKSGGKHQPFPLPELVFGSLLERWNACAPIAFPEDARRYAAECLAVSRYELASRAAPLKSRALRIGAVGQVSYTTLNYDRYWMSIIAALTAFALYSGVGAGTTMGLGQARGLAE
jgi:CRISPR-associated endoribonuclease Cas6